MVGPLPGRWDGLVLFPPDGATGVPTAFDSDTEWPDPVPEARYVGYPVTVGVSATRDPGPDDDPYEVRVVSASLTGPSGPVEVRVLAPGGDPFLTQAVALVPLAELEPATAYEVAVTLRWSGGEETAEGAFTTAD